MSSAHIDCYNGLILLCGSGKVSNRCEDGGQMENRTLEGTVAHRGHSGKTSGCRPQSLAEVNFPSPTSLPFRVNIHLVMQPWVQSSNSHNLT